MFDFLKQIYMLNSETAFNSGGVSTIHVKVICFMVGKLILIMIPCCG